MSRPGPGCHGGLPGTVPVSQFAFARQDRHPLGRRDDERRPGIGTELEPRVAMASRKTCLCTGEPKASRWSGARSQETSSSVLARAKSGYFGRACCTNSAHKRAFSRRLPLLSCAIRGNCAEDLLVSRGYLGPETLEILTNFPRTTSATVGIGQAPISSSMRVRASSWLTVVRG
jgi:hypothetical protein